MYNEASEYVGRIAARKKGLRDGAVNELVERVGLTRREARAFLSGRESGPRTKIKQQRAGRIRTAFEGRLSDLDEAIAAARKTNQGVETKFEGWISAADKHLSEPPRKDPQPEAMRGKTRAEVEAQGGPLSRDVDERLPEILEEHGVKWEYHENGGITADAGFRDPSSDEMITDTKYFRPGTTLRTVRDWLGY